MRSALTYRAKCWTSALTVKDERKLKTTEMKILRMICGKTLKYNIKNEKICNMTGVERLEECLREQKLRWLGHVKRTDEEKAPVKVLNLS